MPFYNKFSAAVTRVLSMAALVLTLALTLVAAQTHATPPPNAIEEGFASQSVAPVSGKQTRAEKAKAKVAADAQKLDALLLEVGVPDTGGESCIRSREIEQIKILSSSMLLVEGRRKTFWLNQFRRQCVGLRRDMVLVMKTHGSRLCALDTIYGRDRFDSGFGGSGILGTASCPLAKFQEISAEQADALRLAARSGAFR